MWAKLDDGAADHPKLWRAAALLHDDVNGYARALSTWLLGLLWVARNLSDGFVPFRVVQGFAIRNPVRVAEMLVEAGLWELVKGGYAIHDYHEYNPRREDVLNERRTTAQRVKRWRERNGGSNAVTNAVDNGVRTPAPSPSLVQEVPQQQAVPPPRAARSDRVAWFEECFWAHYPKKKDKAKALAAWLKLRPTRVFAELVRDAIIEQLTWPTGLGDGREHQRFVKNPATWLNAGAWDDQRDEAQPHVGDRVRCEPCAICGYPDPAHHSRVMCNQLFLEQQRNGETHGPTAHWGPPESASTETPSADEGRAVPARNIERP